jgi:hypothetical protein
MVQQTIPTRTLVTRLSLRPRRLGTTRRKPKGHPSPVRSGAQAGPRREARSLDKNKYLATSVREWLQTLETPWDKYKTKCFYNRVLLKSLFEIAQKHLQEHQALKDREPSPESDAAIDACRKRAERWEAAYQRVHNCQMEWIGFRATCCNDSVAVPVGCNHRLCFLCNSHRAERYRERVRVMFDRLEHPVFLTLTVPNVRRISKRTYNSIRNRIRKLLKQHEGWAKGGLYSLETTYNRNPDSKSYGTWHVHAHILIDSKTPLPCSRPAFIRFKRRLEFDWLLLTGGRKLGWRHLDFDYWFRQTQRTKSERAADHQRDGIDRRVVDIRRVTNRQKAAYEVLKYITKGSDFVDSPDSVEQFMTAVRGTRMIQTWGTWYGFKFPDDVNDWSHLECSCGQNKFERQGRLFGEGVFMGPDGRWRIRKEILERAPT